MLEVDAAEALRLVEVELGRKVKGAKIRTGHDAARLTIELMHRSRQRRTPTYIIDKDDPEGTPHAGRLIGRHDVRGAPREG